MYATKKTANRHGAFTLVELLVVIAIILAISALAAAFAPRVSDSQNLTRAVDRLEQWLLTAKMRAKRDGLATGIRFISDSTGYSQCQYIQQPGPLGGGSLSATATTSTVPAPPLYATPLFLAGSIFLTTPNPAPLPLTPPVPTPPGIVAGQVQIYNFDPTLGGGMSSNQWLVQGGDYLSLQNGGVYFIAGVLPPVRYTVPPLPPIPVTTIQLGVSTYDISLSVTAPTTNFRILRQPRILIGEDPLVLPNNFAVQTTLIPDTIIPGNSIAISPTHWSNVANGTSGVPEILFSPTGAVIGTNAGNSKILISVYDTTMNFTSADDFMSRVGIVAIQSRTGYIGAYSAAQGAGILGYDPFYFAEIGRESGL